MTTTPAEAIAAAWDAWLATDDHNYSCIGYSEGQFCCAESDGVPDDEPSSGYRGRQEKLIDLALSALVEGGFIESREASP